jgi:hypothetical protein
VQRRRRTPEERYKDNTRKQQRTLEDYAAHEIEWADNLLLWFRLNKMEMPEDEYRACAFFLNREFLMKPGSLALLYKMYLQCSRELPEITKENAFDILRYRYRMYAAVLKTGGYDGRENW